MNPNKYTVIDTRTYNTLHKTEYLPETPTSFNPGNYKTYLCKCRKPSNKFNVSLRTLDRALYQKYKNNKIIKTLLDIYALTYITLKIYLDHRTITNP